MFPNSFVGRLVLQFSASDIFGSYGIPEGVGCRAQELSKNAKNHPRPTPSLSKKKFRSMHARYVGGGRVPSSTINVFVWLFRTIVTLTVWFGKVYSSRKVERSSIPLILIAV